MPLRKIFRERERERERERVFVLGVLGQANLINGLSQKKI